MHDKLLQLSTDRLNALKRGILETLEPAVFQRSATTIDAMAYWYRRVILLAIPLILSNLAQPLLSTVDTVLSGHLPGAAALGGVAVGGIFFNGIFWAFGFLRMGTTGLVAQAYGARDSHALRLHLLRAMLSALTIGAAVLAVQGPLIAGAITLLG